MEKFIPCRPGIDVGRGFNTLTGEVRGVAVTGAVGDATTSGQTVKADAKIVESQEQLMEALDVSVEVSGHYGLFSADGRFGLAQQSSYTSQSTYVVARCTVENAFRSFTLPKVSDEAAQRLRDDGPDAFKIGYGDCFVQGLRNGGELYAVFQLTSESSSEQKKIAASLSASVQGVFAGGSVDASVSDFKSSASKLSSLSVLFYQRAGTGDSISPVTSPDEIMKRLHAFPTIAHDSPIGYIAQMVDYQVLALPSFDEVGYAQRIEALQDYAQLKMKYLGIRAEIDLVRRNPDLFVQDAGYTDQSLSGAFDTYTLAVNMLNRHARRVANKEIEPSLFDPPTYDARLKDLPLFVFKKKAAPTSDQISVPNVGGMSVSVAQKALRDVGLNPVSNAISVSAGQAGGLDVITQQAPLPGVSATKGSTVVITYNYVASDRFKRWLTVDRTVQVGRFAVVR